MTIRYCIRELLLLGRQTAKRARINDEVWTAVKRLGINKPVRGTRAGKSSKILERRWAPPDSDSKPMNRLCKMHHSKTAIPDRSKPGLPRTALITTNLQQETVAMSGAGCKDAPTAHLTATGQQLFLNDLTVA